MPYGGSEAQPVAAPRTVDLVRDLLTFNGLIMAGRRERPQTVVATHLSGRRSGASVRCRGADCSQRAVVSRPSRYVRKVDEIAG
jgi:hypothetical protein